MIELNCKKFVENVKKYRELKGYNKGKILELVGYDLSYIGKIEHFENIQILK